MGILTHLMHHRGHIISIFHQLDLPQSTGGLSATRPAIIYCSSEFAPTFKWNVIRRGFPAKQDNQKMKYVKRDTFQKIIERTLQFKLFCQMCPPSGIQTKINAYIFMSHLKLKLFQKLQIKCSHLGTAGKDENEWKECFTSILGKSGAILKKTFASRVGSKIDSDHSWR